MTETGVDVPTQPLQSVTVRIIFPEVLTIIFCVLAPLLHKYVGVHIGVGQPKPTESPAQIEVGPSGNISGTGLGLMVTVTVVVAEHPSAENPVTV